MFTLDNLESVLSSILLDLSKGVKLKKAIERSFYKAFGKPSSDYWINGLGSSFEFTEALSAFSLAVTSEEINAVYSSYETDSCMRGFPVGEFYQKLEVQCAYISGARALINPEDKTFFCVYGPKHYILQSILTLMGFSCTSSWLNNKRDDVKELISITKISSIPYIDGDLEELLSDIL